MSTDKDLDEIITESKEVFEKFAETANAALKRVKKKAKRQRQRMRKRGLRLVQDYCN